MNYFEINVETAQRFDLSAESYYRLKGIVSALMPFLYPKYKDDIPENYFNRFVEHYKTRKEKEKKKGQGKTRIAFLTENYDAALDCIEYWLSVAKAPEFYLKKDKPKYRMEIL